VVLCNKFRQVCHDAQWHANMFSSTYSALSFVCMTPGRLSAYSYIYRGTQLDTSAEPAVRSLPAICCRFMPHSTTIPLWWVQEYWVSLPRSLYGSWPLTSSDKGFRVCQLATAYSFEFACRSSQCHGVPGMACWSCHHDTFLGGHPVHPVSDVCTS